MKVEEIEIDKEHNSLRCSVCGQYPSALSTNAWHLLLPRRHQDWFGAIVCSKADTPAPREKRLLSVAGDWTVGKGVFALRPSPAQSCTPSHIVTTPTQLETTPLGTVELELQAGDS